MCNAAKKYVSLLLFVILLLPTCEDYKPCINRNDLDNEIYDKDLKHCRREGDKADVTCADVPSIFGLCTLGCGVYSILKG